MKRKAKEKAAPPVARPAQATPAWLPWIAPLLAVVLYLPSLANGFVLDDQALILEDPRMGSLGNLFSVGPGELIVRYWSLLIDSAIWGTRPLGFHLTNVLLFAVTAWVLFRYLRALAHRVAETAPSPPGSRCAPWGLAWSDWAALGGSLVFVAHPMLTEAVAGVTHRKEILSTLFLLAGLHRSLDRDRSWLRAIEVSAWVGLAVLAKAPAIVFFPLVFLQDLWLRDRSISLWLRRDLVFYSIPVVTGVAYIISRWDGLMLALQGRPEYFLAYNPQVMGLDTGPRLLTCVSTLGLYWGLLLVPFQPTLERYVAPVETLSAPLPWLLVLIGGVMLVGAFRVGRKRPLLGMGLAWLALTPIPTLNLIPLNFLFSERYLFLPAVGVTLLAAHFILIAPRRWASAGRTTLIAVALFLAIGIPQVVKRVLEWRSVDTLLAATVRDNRSSPTVLFFHAQELRDQGRIVESQAEVALALRINPRSSRSWYLAGRNLVELGRRDEALQAFENAVNIAKRPRPGWLNDYAVELLKAGRVEEARDRLDTAVRQDPANEQARDNRIQAYLSSAETRAQGFELLEEELRTYPERQGPWMLYVDAVLAGGDSTRSVAAVTRARQHVTGEFPLAFLDGRLAEALGDHDRARRFYELLLGQPDLDPSLRTRAQRGLARVRTSP